MSVNNNDQGKVSARFLNLLMSSWWLRHLLFWVFIILYFTWAFGFTRYTFQEAFLNSIAYIPGDLVVVYILLYFLIPQFLFKRKFFLFFGGFVLTLIIAKYISEFIAIQTASNNALRGFRRRQGHFITPFVNVASIAAAIKLIKYFYLQEKKALVAKSEQTETELELLKSQVHPNFLFNTLNSLFGHTQRKSAESPKIVVGLSELLRFMIYESKVEFVPLDEEIQLMNNYINLEKLRFRDDLDVSFTYSGDIESKLIRPLLLLPLVENSFTNGTQKVLEQKWISINLHVEGEHMLFKLTNSWDSNLEVANENTHNENASLANVKKRLELLYPGQYELLIRKDNDMMLISLELSLVTNTVSGIDRAISRQEEALLADAS